MGKCRYHHFPDEGSFQIGTEYEYLYGIDFIGMTDDNGKNFISMSIPFYGILQSCKINELTGQQKIS